MRSSHPRFLSSLAGQNTTSCLWVEHSQPCNTPRLKGECHCSIFKCNDSPIQEPAAQHPPWRCRSVGLGRSTRRSEEWGSDLWVGEEQMGWRLMEMGSKRWWGSCTPWAIQVQELFFFFTYDDGKPMGRGMIGSHQSLDSLTLAACWKVPEEG